MAMVRMASLTLRERVRSGVNSATLTNCWVMVLPPSSLWPVAVLYKARKIPPVSKP